MLWGLFGGGRKERPERSREDRINMMADKVLGEEPGTCDIKGSLLKKCRPIVFKNARDRMEHCQAESRAGRLCDAGASFKYFAQDAPPGEFPLMLPKVKYGFPFNDRIVVTIHADDLCSDEKAAELESMGLVNVKWQNSTSGKAYVQAVLGPAWVDGSRRTAPSTWLD